MITLDSTDRDLPMFIEPNLYDLSISVNNEDNKISYFLKSLGIKQYKKGFKYLRDAIRLTMEDYSNIELITKIMYPKIAKLNGTTPSRVERAIRHCTKDLNTANPHIIYAVFGYMNDRYTNKEIIVAMSEYLTSIK